MTTKNRIKNYSIYCGEGRSRHLIVLEDPHRTYFKPISPNSQQIRDLEILKRLFRRIPAMIIAFKGNNTQEEPISIIPSRRLPAALGEEAIPFYYYKDDEGFSYICAHNYYYLNHRTSIYGYYNHSLDTLLPSHACGRDLAM